MITIGENVQCEITNTGEWGAYAKTKTGEEVFISFGELSWERIQKADEIISPGDTVDVKILENPTEDRSRYLGSLKRTKTNDPWTGAGMDAGSIHGGEVVRVGKDVAFINLTNGIVVGVQVENPTCLSIGESVQVKLDEVDSNARVAKATIVHPK